MLLEKAAYSREDIFVVSFLQILLGEPLEKCLGILLFFSAYFALHVCFSIWMLLMFVRLIFMYITFLSAFVLLVAYLCDMVNIRVVVDNEERPVRPALVLCAFFILLLYIFLESIALQIVHSYFVAHFKT